MVDCYEALREAVVEKSEGAYPVQGRALFMFKGMAVWIKSMGDAVWRSAAPITQRNESPLPVGIEQNVVNLMATMVLANAREDIA